MNRQEANLKIVADILATIQKYPDWRFHQILQNLNINVMSGSSRGNLIDLWYEESSKTLERMKGSNV